MDGPLRLFSVIALRQAHSRVVKYERNALSVAQSAVGLLLFFEHLAVFLIDERSFVVLKSLLEWNLQIEYSHRIGPYPNVPLKDQPDEYPSYLTRRLHSLAVYPAVAVGPSRDRRSATASVYSLLGAAYFAFQRLVCCRFCRIFVLLQQVSHI